MTNHPDHREPTPGSDQPCSDQLGPGQTDAGRGDPAQYLAAAVLAALGSITIIGTMGVKHGAASNDTVGPRAFPFLVGALLLVVSVVYAVNVYRGGRGSAEAGEDVEAGSTTDWRALAILAAVFAANALFIEQVGWVISGTLMFWGSVLALGNRHYVRSLFVAVLLALGTFYGFAIGLGVGLPAGVLQGVL